MPEPLQGCDKGSSYANSISELSRRLSENKTPKRAAPNWIRGNLKIPEAKFNFDQKLHGFNVRTRS